MKLQESMKDIIAPLLKKSDFNVELHKQDAGVSCQIIREDNITKINLMTAEFCNKEELDIYIRKLSELSNLLN